MLFIRPLPWILISSFTICSGPYISKIFLCSGLTPKISFISCDLPPPAACSGTDPEAAVEARFGEGGASLSAGLGAGVVAGLDTGLGAGFFDAILR